MDSTKTPDAPAAPVTHAQLPPLGDALGDLRSAALAKARQERLDCADGTWLCWGCGGEYEPFHVSLHCPWCLQQARDRHVEQLRAEAARSDADRQWEAICEKMARDSRVDRDVGLSLLDKARELPSATPERVQALEIAFGRRFARPRRQLGEAFASHAEPGENEVWDT